MFRGIFFQFSLRNSIENSEKFLTRNAVDVQGDLFSLQNLVENCEKFLIRNAFDVQGDHFSLQNLVKQ